MMNRENDVNIRLSLKEFLDNRDKYKEYDDKFIRIRLKNENSAPGKELVITLDSLPDKLTNYEGKEYVIPKYISNVKLFLNKHDFSATIDNFDVIIDVETHSGEMNLPRQLAKGTFINIYDYVESEQQHWLNRKVLGFFKTQFPSGVIMTTPNYISSCKDIFKKLTICDNVPVDYKKILKLFEMTGQSDRSFENYLFGKKKG